MTSKIIIIMYNINSKREDFAKLQSTAKHEKIWGPERH